MKPRPASARIPRRSFFKGLFGGGAGAVVTAVLPKEPKAEPNYGAARDEYSKVEPGMVCWSTAFLPHHMTPEFLAGVCSTSVLLPGHKRKA